MGLLNLFPTLYDNSRFAADSCNARPSGTTEKAWIFGRSYLASVKREGRTRRKREKEKANQHVIIHTDNEAAIHIINKGTTSIPLLSVI